MTDKTNDLHAIRAVGMLSGGLDSILATRVMLEQGISVTPVHVETGLTYARRNRLAGHGPSEPSGPERAARMLDLELVTIEAFEPYISVITNPQHGYGSAMNPCVDCRVFLLRQAKAWMEGHDHNFIFTGEVLAQRPNSQMRRMLDLVERESGLEGLLLRPLSAKLLEATIPEKRGWVNREELYGFHGRSRKPQMELAQSFGITYYPQPAGGGCFLVDQNYSRRLKDFLDHEGVEALTTQQAFLLSVGRHVRLPSGRKVIVGRHEEENAYIASQSDQGTLMTTLDQTGPTTLVTGDPPRDETEVAAQITARYSGADDNEPVRVEVRYDALEEIVTVEPMALEDIHALMV
ncbi:MAG: tRNA (5-methylaminomethyl-2-thiouridylate)-methyltransferase [Anaerolineae bacterium]